MSFDQSLAGGDFIKTPKKDAIKQESVKTHLFDVTLDEIRKGLTLEEERLRQLNERFLTLEASVEKLRGTIETERYLHRKLIDEMVREATDYDCDCIEVPDKPPVDVMELDHELIKAKIRELAPSVGTSEETTVEIDLEQIKSNLEMYRLEMSEVKRKEILSKKRNATVKMLQEHLSFIEKKCDHEMMKLENIQQDIKHLELNDNMENSGLETIFRTNSSNFQMSSETPSQSNSYDTDSNEHVYLPKTE